MSPLGSTLVYVISTLSMVMIPLYLSPGMMVGKSVLTRRRASEPAITNWYPLVGPLTGRPASSILDPTPLSPLLLDLRSTYASLTCGRDLRSGGGG